MSILMNNTDKHYINNWSKKFKNITINRISNKPNNAVIVIAVKLNANVLTYKDNIHKKL